MGIKEEERRKKISKTEREKRDKGEKERVMEGKKAEREKRRRKISNENEVRTKISIVGEGSCRGAVEPKINERPRD